MVPLAPDDDVDPERWQSWEAPQDVHHVIGPELRGPVLDVGGVFDDAVGQRWDATFFPLETRDDVRADCRHNFIPAERAATVELPLWLTKRGVIVRRRSTDAARRALSRPRIHASSARPRCNHRCRGS